MRVSLSVRQSAVDALVARAPVGMSGMRFAADVLESYVRSCAPVELSSEGNSEIAVSLEENPPEDQFPSKETLEGVAAAKTAARSARQKALRPKGAGVKARLGTETWSRVPEKESAGCTHPKEWLNKFTWGVVCQCGARIR